MFNKSLKKSFHEAELLIILFNMRPEVQVKTLMRIGVKEELINNFLIISTLFNKRKERLIIKNKPKNRKEIILIEDDVMKSLYEARELITNADPEEIIKKKHPKALIINHKQIDKLELIMDMNDRSVDYLVFTKRKIISYIIKKIKNY